MDCSDPCWEIPKRYVDPSRLEYSYKKLNQIEENNPQWIEDLSSGMPTYYGILGVSKNSSNDEIERSYEKKIDYSTYPEDTIDEAYTTLINRESKKEYEKALKIFFKVLLGLTPREKREMTQEHDEWLSDEMEHAVIMFIEENHPNWLVLYSTGAPTLYRMAKRAKSEELKNEAKKILKNVQLRQEYDLMLNILKKIKKDKEIELKKWDGDEELLLLLLKYPSFLDKFSDIINEHSDWRDYIPPKATFYNIMGIEKETLPKDKRNAERGLREVYKSLDRTPEVNFAYSVLKNTKMRGDYDWVLENIQLIRQIVPIEDLGVQDEVFGQKDIIQKSKSDYI